MILGAHISTAGGIEKSPKRGAEFGLKAIQVFSKNQRQWEAAPVSELEAGRFCANMKKYGIAVSAVHDSYLINLAAGNSETYNKSCKAFEDEVLRAGMLSIPFLIFHPGSHVGTGEKKGIQSIGRAVKKTVELTSDSGVSLLFETTAGQGTALGYTFQQIRDMIEASGESSRLGVCFDTAHAFAAGYDIRTEEAFEETFEEFSRIIGIERLKAFHLNDSKKELGSKVDRHEHIGKGHIGKKPFGYLLNDSRFQAVPGYLETPGGAKFYTKNLQALDSI